MRPGETNPLKKTVVFKLFDVDGLPCSGEADEGDVFVPIAGEVQLSVDFDAYANVVDHTDLVHIGDGDYKFMFDDSETNEPDGTWLLLRVKRNTGPLEDQIRTQTIALQLKYDDDDVLALMKHNAVIDLFVYDPGNGMMTSCRIRVFATAAAAAAATTDAANGADGEIMRFTVTAVDNGDGKPERHQLVREL